MRSPFKSIVFAFDTDARRNVSCRLSSEVVIAHAFTSTVAKRFDFPI